MSDPPEGWRLVLLGDVIDGFETGRSFQAEGRPAGPGESGVLKISAVSWGEFDPSENKALRSGDEPKPSELVQQGDVLLSRANTSALVGAAVRVRDPVARLMLPDKILRLRLRTSIIDPDYLVQALRTTPVRHHFEANATGTSDSMRNLSQPKIASAPFPLPTLPEQRRIVAKLDALQSKSRRAKDALDAIPPLLDRFRQAVLAAAFRGDLTADWRAKHPDVEPVPLSEDGTPENTSRKHLWGSGRTTVEVDPAWGNLPRGWQWARIRDLNEIPDQAVQIGPMSMKSNEFIEQGIMVLNVGCVQRGRIDTSKADYLPAERARDFERYRLNANDVLFTRSGTVGRCAMLPHTLDGSLMTFHLLRVRPSPNRCLPTYLMLAFQGATSVAAQIATSSVGATRAGFNTRLLEDLWVPLAPRAEQEELLRCASSLLAIADRSHAQLKEIADQLAGLDQAILAKAFRGELVPQDPNDEPAIIHPAASTPPPPTDAAPRPRTRTPASKTRKP